MIFLLCDPGWCVHKSDFQNKWDDNTHIHMTKTTGPDCAVMCNLINTHTHTETYYIISIIDPPLGGSMRVT